MTRERMKTANEIMKKIEGRRRFLEELKEPCGNIITASGIDSPSRACIVLLDEPELYEMVVEYIKTKIAELEKQLEEL